MNKSRPSKADSPRTNAAVNSAAPQRGSSWRIYIIYALGILALLAAYPAWIRATASWKFGEVRTLLASGKVSEALHAAQGLPDTSGSPGEAFFLRAICFRRNNELPAALDNLKRAKAAGWPEEQVKRQRMMTLYQGGDARESEEYLLNLAQKGGTDEEADELFECMAKGQLAQDRVLDARLTLETWLKWRSKNAQALIWLAETFERDQSYKEAIKYYTAALELAPEDRTSRLSLANMYLAANKIEEAQTHFDALVKRNGDDDLAKLGLAQCLIRLGQKPEASTLLKSIQADNLPANPRGVYYSTMGALATDEKQYEEAVKHFTQSLKLAPEYTGTHTQLAQAYARLGKTELAAKHLAESKALFEKQQELTGLLADINSQPRELSLRIKLANLQKELGQNVAAISAAHQALQLDPKSTEAHAILSEVYTRMGNKMMADRHAAISQGKPLPPPGPGEPPPFPGPDPQR
ncbi:MAG: tetratricopeptide repeat protein [Planctomycetaceae bacterium]